MADILTKAALPSADKTAADRTPCLSIWHRGPHGLCQVCAAGKGNAMYFGTLNSAETGEGFPA
jgi:hypothetical protein